MESVEQLLEFELVSIGEYSVKVFNLVIVLAIFLWTKLLLWAIKKALLRRVQFDEIEKGNRFALLQLIRYIFWVIAIGLMLEAMGFKLTVVLAGSAALMVGVGLGLQQTFNDMVSGVILLSERSIRINDILEIDGDIILIQNIGFRTSKGLNRDGISIIIPNSLITTNKVINWSHQTRKTRFKVDVGVAYGSNVDLVIKALEESVEGHPEVNTDDPVEVRFLAFNNSSLDFQLLFYSENVFRIEGVKSDIRKRINKKFAEYKITIPFQQVDLHFKTNFPETANETTLPPNKSNA